MIFNCQTLEFSDSTPSTKTFEISALREWSFSRAFPVFPVPDAFYGFSLPEAEQFLLEKKRRRGASS